MPHFTPQNLVGGRHIAGKANAVYVGAIPRFDEESDVDGLFVVVNLRHTRCLGEGIT